MAEYTHSVFTSIEARAQQSSNLELVSLAAFLTILGLWGLLGTLGIALWPIEEYRELGARASLGVGLSWPFFWLAGNCSARKPVALFFCLFSGVALAVAAQAYLGGCLAIVAIAAACSYFSTIDLARLAQMWWKDCYCSALPSNSVSARFRPLQKVLGGANHDGSKHGRTSYWIGLFCYLVATALLLVILGAFFSDSIASLLWQLNTLILGLIFICLALIVGLLYNGPFRCSGFTLLIILGLLYILHFAEQASANALLAHTEGALICPSLLGAVLCILGRAFDKGRMNF